VESDPGERTRTLIDAARGDARSADRLLPLIYTELRALASKYLKGERPGHTLQPTALVHEAYLRLIRIEEVDWEGKTHFFAMAAREMRRVLVDHARRRDADKRGGGAERMTFSEGVGLVEDRVIDVIALDEALRVVEARNPRRARVAELRIFAGLQIDEIATALGITARAAKEDWRMARAWIGRELA
jgi:RNA polymerase sigma factor (TIGR02999 family)